LISILLKETQKTISVLMEKQSIEKDKTFHARASKKILRLLFRKTFSIIVII
jgi:hypothetical protein